MKIGNIQLITTLIVTLAMWFISSLARNVPCSMWAPQGQSLDYGLITTSLESDATRGWDRLRKKEMTYCINISGARGTMDSVT